MAGVLPPYASCAIFCHLWWGMGMIYFQRYSQKASTRGLREKSVEKKIFDTLKQSQTPESRKKSILTSKTAEGCASLAERYDLTQRPTAEREVFFKKSRIMPQHPRQHEVKSRFQFDSENSSESSGNTDLTTACSFAVYSNDNGYLHTHLFLPVHCPLKLAPFASYFGR
ncbi:hypothetical protein EVAR_63449_1 [Eumeta japonica]|uniref:Uncharacterized protein n=1 Tax=Eumeta variegata TaxID=151549 RepID=A0A4C1YVC3_EUMVA|nr:hypothetical protein EVAR_63449_1 [Eumeta japonica]